MKMLVNVRIPNESFNQHVRQGTVGPTIQRILEDAGPEFVYFTEQSGSRGLVMLVEVSTPDRVPSLAEPWYLQFDAECEFRIAMSPEELGKAGLAELGAKWS